jgi:hypothetical protein
MCALEAPDEDIVVPFAKFARAAVAAGIPLKGRTAALFTEPRHVRSLERISSAAALRQLAAT